MVGIPGVSGLSTEHHKCLTIAVEVLANPSIIFMDEPTTGLDAISVAILMRAVKNIVGLEEGIVIAAVEAEVHTRTVLMKKGASKA